MIFAIAGIMEASTPGGMDEDSAGATMVGLFMFAAMGTTLIALGLGIGGLLQKERNKIFAILGTTFSLVAIAGTLFLLLLGLAME